MHLSLDMLTDIVRKWLSSDEASIREKAVASLVAVYFTGFLVTNLYLGSLGVVGLELLRVKYITSAILFLLFACSVCIPIIGVLRILRESNEGLGFSTIGKLTMHTFESFFVITIFLMAIGLLSGTQATIENSGLIERMGFLVEIQIWAWLVVLFVGISLAGLVFLLCLVGILKILLNRAKSEGVEKKPFKISLIVLLKDYIKFISTLPWLAGFLLVFSIHGLGNSTIAVVSLSQDFSFFASHFLRAAFFIYAIAVVVFLFLYLKWLNNKNNENNKSPRSIDATVDLLEGKGVGLLIFTFVLSIYSLYVYPTMPQQAGGGKAIPVTIKANTQTLNEMLASLNEIELLDKTNVSIVFRAKDSSGLQRIFEFSKSAVDSIEYIKPKDAQN